MLAEVFEVFLHPLHQVDGLAAVGVQKGVGVGVEHHSGVGLVAGAQGAVLLVALLVGLLQRRGLQAGAVLLEGCILLVVGGGAELVNGALPGLVLQTGKNVFDKPNADKLDCILRRENGTMKWNFCGTCYDGRPRHTSDWQNRIQAGLSNENREDNNPKNYERR